ncbi:MAG: type IV pili twitching motility protein PilT [Candidatus Doudnabacteria bacterium RIFCSPHIGHO2_02_FULL_48_21]|uniref:Type IV pili twitching motility protein PilT n=1 Tax=Candidatus Doudnabacteria bacterium RIFCSPLOWO2_02_FULL_48_13 TaxID=1817845 RepID=A0A1F5QD87_9BACT|nr:MAG: type IV pili twitching motility protein PilT [Candidatus Doudnabacteria bacterium RIFCSPHIGHO2_01_48_18]OGE77092.1 MAG: type IV pili twitching motility protein PilT [Candidatus Doudnabacteria bacterium RIFCSPHIGHO2_01_FULL_48_180]OGE91633.1 MAG: type IV pili twitching motility protein PilT [Candidatus Doudnabacteria bacterium RIFCSPHIGHO2_12_FULL_47_25]OGE93247.1 MAG: type IV pili twitching motility protein PilT [Candidatus Doudnabacteria bacterium RIFCSPHIGHO2_02_FULL_48_21]OGE96370.1 
MSSYKNQGAELERFLAHVLETGASDLHLVAGKPPTVRIDSALVSIADEPILDGEKISELVDVMLADFQKKSLEEKKQVDLSYDFKGDARFRVNVYYQKGTMAAAMRHIPNKISTVEELNLPAQLTDLTRHKEGLVLFVGPTGHGKSTTLAALIDIINHSRADHIITIEDPIEYIFTQDKALISQREVLQDTTAFPEALRATLREDVNVILIGEMRDLESISTAITVAETGHLVFATLHTNDAPQTMDRIIDVFPAHQQNQVRSQLANILIGVVSQRLLPRVGGGRVPAVEIMLSTNAVRNVIREGRTYELPNIIHTSTSEGMISMDKALADLVRKGLVKLEDGLAYSSNEELFKSLVRRY